jgi:hypothetical protein
MAVGFPTKANWAAGDVLTASAMDDLAGTVNTVQYLKPWNTCLNSNMSVWQRGTSISVPAGSALYTADRWYMNVTGSGNNYTVSRFLTSDTTSTATVNLQQIQYAARIQRIAGQTGVNPAYFCNMFETVNSIPYAGQSITLSFYARAGSNFSSSSNIINYTVQSGTGTDQNLFSYSGGATVMSGTKTLTTTWQRFSATGTVPLTATELSIYFNFTPTGTAGANDYYEITGVQFEQGSVANTYQPNQATYQGELAACQRYYYRRNAVSGGSSTFFGESAAWTVSTTYFNMTLPVSMRVNPSAIDTSAMSTFGWQQNGGATSYNTPASIVLSLGGTSTENVALLVSKTSSFTSGSYYELGATNTGAYVGVSAEL